MSTIYGTEDGEVIPGTTDNDVIYALGGDDTLFGDLGDDLLFGGTGDDLYVFTTGFGNDLVGDGLNGSNDRILLEDWTINDIRLTTNSADQLIIHIEGAPDTIAISEHLNGVSIETIEFGLGPSLDLTGGLVLTGDASDDAIYGTALNDRIFGQDGADLLYGNNGDDRIDAGNGADVVYGDSNLPTAFDGNDVIRLYDGDDWAFGGNGNDHISGGEGDDQIFGGDGRDRLFGYGDNDLLSGGAGNDQMTGGSGDDTFQFEADNMRNLVTDFGFGDDVLDFSYTGMQFSDLSFRPTYGGTDLLIDVGGVTQVVLANTTLADLDPLTDFIF